MWNKEFTKLLLLKYQQHELLYNILHTDYLNTTKRNNALFKICTELSYRNENITVEDIKKKMSTLRTQYVKELRLISKSQRIGVKNVYEPKLWCFKELSFLKPFCVTATLEPLTQYVSVVDDMEFNSDDESVEEKPDISRSLLHQEEDTRPESTKKRKKPDSADDFLVLAAKKMMEPPDESLQISEVWAAKFRKLSPIQQIYAEKFISDILFEGQLENLSRESVIINTGRAKSSIDS